MRILIVPAWDKISILAKRFSAAAALSLISAAGLFAAQRDEAGGEANLRLPDLSSVSFLGIDGHKLLLYGIGICILGLLFGMIIFNLLKNMPVHR
jgi:K(+)-stimulated pyrophosphate-energized sodium pump